MAEGFLAGWPGAAARAEGLLRSHLSPSQLAQYERHGGFAVVRGPDVYVILVGVREGVYDLREGWLRGYTAAGIHAAGLPDADVALAAKLKLEADPDHFRSKACRMYYRFSGGRAGTWPRVLAIAAMATGEGSNGPYQEGPGLGSRFTSAELGGEERSPALAAGDTYTYTYRFTISG